MNSADEKLSGRSAPNAVRAPLGFAMKRALVILLEDELLIAEEHRWRSPKDRTVINQTFYSLYDRYLVKVVVDSRHRKRHTASLTDVGYHAACSIQRELVDRECRKEEADPRGISEASARFIQQVTS